MIASRIQILLGEFIDIYAIPMTLVPLTLYRAFQEGGPKAGLIFVVALVTVEGIRTLRMYGVT